MANYTVLFGKQVLRILCDIGTPESFEENRSNVRIGERPELDYIVKI